MKNQLIILFLFLFCGLPFSKAQVTEDNRSMSQGSHTAYIIDIPNTNEKFVENIWKKYLKSFGGKSKKNRSTEEIITSSAKISAIGKGNRVDLYTILDQLGDDVSLLMWVDLGEEFLSKRNKNSQVQGAKDFLEDFAKEVKREIIRLQVKEEGNKLQKMEVNLKRLERDSVRFVREIELAEAKILKNQTKIEDNRITREELLHNIEIQKMTLDSIKLLRYN
jgi:leucyl-tRNA synthetase